MCGRILMPTEKFREKEATVSTLTYKHENIMEGFDNYFLLLAFEGLKQVDQKNVLLIIYLNKNQSNKNVILPCFIRNAF